MMEWLLFFGFALRNPPHPRVFQEPIKCYQSVYSGNVSRTVVVPCQ